MVKIFGERMQIIGANSTAVGSVPDPKIQKLLSDEYNRLYQIGMGGAINTKVDLPNTSFILNTHGESAFISAEQLI